MRTRDVFLFFMISRNVFTQSFIPIPDSNAIWIQAEFSYFGNHEHETSTGPLSFGNDSIFGGMSYHTLHGQAIADWIDN